MSEFFQGFFTLLLWLINWLWDWIKEHPKYMFFVALGFVGLMGTLIETGKRGVLYHFGRATRILEPGFHFLIPGLQQVKKVHIRDRTLDLYAQRVTSQEGIVYHLDSSLLFRICNPIQAAVNIDDVKKGCETILALTIQKILRTKTEQEILKKEQLEEKIQQEVILPLSYWGIEVIRVGFTSISPSPESLQLTQLRLRVQNKHKVLQQWKPQNLKQQTTIFLFGVERTLVSKSHARYLTLQKERERKATHVKQQKNEQETLPST